MTNYAKTTRLYILIAMLVTVSGCTVGTVGDVAEEGHTSQQEQAYIVWYQCGAPASLLRCTNYKGEINIDGEWLPLNAGCDKYCSKIGAHCDKVNAWAEAASGACHEESSFAMRCECRFYSYYEEEVGACMEEL